GNETVKTRVPEGLNLRVRSPATRALPSPQVGAGRVGEPGNPKVTALRASRAADGSADAGEGLVGVGAQRGDGRDAHHDDEGQHARVFNGRRAVFTLQKIHQGLSELTHESLSFEVGDKTRFPK